MFLERMIVGRLQGEPMRQVHANEGWIKLLETVSKIIIVEFTDALVDYYPFEY